MHVEVITDKAARIKTLVEEIAALDAAAPRTAFTLPVAAAAARSKFLLPPAA